MTVPVAKLLLDLRAILKPSTNVTQRQSNHHGLNCEISEPNYPGNLLWSSGQE
jgi:hypothetical protein